MFFLSLSLKVLFTNFMWASEYWRVGKASKKERLKEINYFEPSKVSGSVIYHFMLQTIETSHVNSSTPLNMKWKNNNNKTKQKKSTKICIPLHDGVEVAWKGSLTIFGFNFNRYLISLLFLISFLKTSLSNTLCFFPVANMYCFLLVFKSYYRRNKRVKIQTYDLQKEAGQQN